jgi:hypothetical protein
MSKLLVLSIIILSIVSCSKGGDERVAEQESIRATEQVNAENENRRRLSEGPEQELNGIKYFMRSVEGEYKTSIEISGIPLDVYIEIIPSKEIVFYSRIRTSDEILADKQQLTLTVKALIENPNVLNSGSTCIFEEHRPNIRRGQMKLIKEGCKNIFRLSLGEGINVSDIITNRQEYVDQLKGSLSTGVNSKKYDLLLERL